jgi:anti-repressor protein
VSEIERYDFDGHTFEVIWIDGQPAFDALHVCDLMQAGNPWNWTRGLDEDEHFGLVVETSRGPEERLFWTEPGLYSVLGRLPNPEAKRFRRYVNHEILPAFRRGELVHRTQAAAPALPQDYASALRALATQVEALAAAEQRLAITAPKAEQYDRWQTSKDAVYVVEWAKAIGLTQHEAYEALRAEGVLFRQRHEGIAFNVPKRGYEQYFELIDEYLDGPKRWTKVPKVTPEGQVYLAELLAERGWIPR